MNNLIKTCRTIFLQPSFGQNVIKLTSFNSKFYYSNAAKSDIGFGILCDVDGVLTRGRCSIKAAEKAFEYLRNENGEWRAPVLFLTNAGNTLKESKANELSKILNQTIRPTDIVMSHTALRLYDELFDKHVAICGQGPVKEIARNIGFKNVSTIEDIAAAFPALDAVIPKEEINTDVNNRKRVEKIEAVVVLGEPQVWERHLQLILDLLLHHGDLSTNLEECRNALIEGEPHLPIFACSSDLVWAGEASSPRIALGSFLLCLENLFGKMTGGRKLEYTAIIGKPSPVTYAFAISQLNAITAKHFGTAEPLKRIYCIGDNPDVDIYGANLYNKCLQMMSEEALQSVASHVDSIVQSEHPTLSPMPYKSIATSVEQTAQTSNAIFGKLVENSISMPTLVRKLFTPMPNPTPPCILQSILVLTGVYQEHEHLRNNWQHMLDPNNLIHPDFPDLENYRVPNFVAKDISEAIEYILSLEGEMADTVDVTRAHPFYDDAK